MIVVMSSVLKELVCASLVTSLVGAPSDSPRVGNLDKALRSRSPEANDPGNYPQKDALIKYILKKSEEREQVHHQRRQEAKERF